MPNLYIVRGLPGSGKSTFVRSQGIASSNDCWIEADMFFENPETGEYKWEGKLIEEAHQWCYTNTIRHLRNGKNVWVSNTFTRLWEMNPYILDVGELIDKVDVTVFEIKTQFKSIHGIPEKSMKAMRARWEEIPAEWEGTFVTGVYRITE